MHNVNVETTSGYISGEIKSAIAIRLLADRDAYDLDFIVDVHFDHCKRILHEVLLK